MWIKWIFNSIFIKQWTRVHVIRFAITIRTICAITAAIHLALKELAATIFRIVIADAFAFLLDIDLSHSFTILGIIEDAVPIFNDWNGLRSDAMPFLHVLQHLFLACEIIENGAIPFPHVFLHHKCDMVVEALECDIIVGRSTDVHPILHAFQWRRGKLPGKQGWIRQNATSRHHTVASDFFI